MHGIRIINTHNIDDDEPKLINIPSQNDSPKPIDIPSEPNIKQINILYDNNNNNILPGNYILKFDRIIENVENYIPEMEYYVEYINGQNEKIARDLKFNRTLKNNSDILQKEIYFTAKNTIKSIYIKILCENNISNIKYNFSNINLYKANQYSSIFHNGFCTFENSNEQTCQNWVQYKANNEVNDIIDKYDMYCDTTDKLSSDPICTQIFKKRKFKNRQFKERIKDKWKKACETDFIHQRCRNLNEFDNDNDFSDDDNNDLIVSSRAGNNINNNQNNNSLPWYKKYKWILIIIGIILLAIIIFFIYKYFNNKSTIKSDNKLDNIKSNNKSSDILQITDSESNNKINYSDIEL